MNQEITSIDQYIDTFPSEVQTVLKKVRTIITEAAPEADESISYGMPTYKIKGKPLVYFGAFKKHIGLYAIPSGQSKFADELSSYKQGKGSVQFPLDRDIPFYLIQRMVEARVAENAN